MSEECGECRFWVLHRFENDTQSLPDGTERRYVGQCRRSPPQIVLDDDSTDMQVLINGAGNLVDDQKCPGPMDAVGLWPLTAADDWCGEFSSK